MEDDLGAGREFLVRKFTHSAPGAGVSEKTVDNPLTYGFKLALCPVPRKFDSVTHRRDRMSTPRSCMFLGKSLSSQERGRGRRVHRVNRLLTSCMATLTGASFVTIYCEHIRQLPRRQRDGRFCYV